MKNLVAALTLRFIDRLSGPSRGAAAAIGQLKRAQEMGAAASSKWSQGLEQLDGKLTRLASASLITDGIGRAGEAMMRPLRGAAAVAQSYEHQLIKIGDTADLSAGQLNRLNRQIMETSRLGRAPTKIAAMADIFVAGGMDSVTAGNLLATTTKVSIGQGVEEATAANAAMAFNQSLKVSAEEMEGAFDAAAKSAKEGRFELKAMADYLPIIGSVGANRGLTGRAGVSELTAALTTIMDKTQDEAATANQLKDLLLKADAEQTANAFRKFGVDVVAGMEEARRSGKSPIDAILDLTAQAQGKGARLNQLFTDQEAFLGLQALRDGRDRFNEVREAANAAGAVVETSYRRMRATGQEKQEGYAAAMERLGVAVGTILAPAVSLAADALGKVADWMGRASASGGLLAKAAVWAVAGFAGFAVAAGAVGQAVVGVLGPFLIMKTLFGTMGWAAVQKGAANVVGAIARMRIAALSFNLTLLANPVVLGVAAAVAAVALVAVVVRKYWEPIKAFFGGVGDALGEAFGPALSAIGSALAPLKPAWDAVTGAVSGFFGWIGRLLQPMQATQGQLDGAANAGRRFGRGLVVAFNLSPIGLFVNGLRFAFRAVRTVMAWRPGEVMRRAWSGLMTFTPLGPFVGGLRVALGAVRTVLSWRPMDVVRAAWTGFMTFSPVGVFLRGLRAGFTAIRAVIGWRPDQALRAAWAGAAGVFGGISARFHGFGRMILQGLINGIRSMLSGVQNAVMETGSSAVTWFKNRLGIRSPSRVFAGLGSDTMAGLTLGLERGGKGAIGQAAAVGAAMLAAMPASSAFAWSVAPTVPAAPSAEASAMSQVARQTAAQPVAPQPFAPVAPAAAATPRIGRGDVSIDNLTIHVTLQGGGGSTTAQGAAAGRAVADAFRARLFDGFEA